MDVTAGVIDCMVLRSSRFRNGGKTPLVGTGADRIVRIDGSSEIVIDVGKGRDPAHACQIGSRHAESSNSPGTRSALSCGSGAGGNCRADALEADLGQVCPGAPA